MNFGQKTGLLHFRKKRFLKRRHGFDSRLYGMDLKFLVKCSEQFLQALKE